MKLRVESYADGWAVFTSNNSKLAAWDHNDPGAGGEELAELLETLGHEVDHQEVY